MTTHYRTRAFIFKRENINESDRIFSAFTDNFGRLDIFAKAIRKTASKLRGGIDVFFMSDIEFIQGKNRKTLTDASVLDKFGGISQDIEKFKIANEVGEVLDNFIKGEEKDKNLFNLLDETFCKLNDKNFKIKKGQLLYYYFLWSALSLLGYRPEADKCNVCQGKLNPYSVYFSDKLGGIICKKCLGQDVSAQKINSDIVKILRLILKKDWKVLFKLKIESSSQKLLKKISDNYYFYILSGQSSKNISRVGAEMI